jgi:PAS domain S-box-containing protein
MTFDAATTAPAGTPGAAGPLSWGEDTFRSLCEALPVGVLFSDALGKILYMNPALEEMVGQKLTSPLASWEELIEPDDRERVRACWRELENTPGPLRTDFRFRRLGEVRWCALLVSSVPAAGGAGHRFVAVFEDLTSRIAAEEALRQSEDRFRTIFEGAGVGLVLGNVNGDIVRVNRAYAEFLGYAPHELSGRNIREFVDADQVTKMLRHLRDLQARKVDRVDVERRHLRRDGTRVWAHVTMTRLPDTSLLIGVVQNMDARKRAEDSVRRLSGRFLHLQDEERRRIARSLHESAAQTVAALAMNLQRLERMELPQLAAEALADALALAEQTSREIRTLSHLLHPPLLEEAGLPSSLRWLVQGFAQRSEVQVTLEAADDLGRLSTELEITLFRIVQESLTNVHRHSGSQSASVRLRRSGPELILEVEDHGSGMRGEALELLGMESGALLGVGIAGMRERLSQLGGTLEIAPANPGVLVRARIRSEAK